MKYEHIFDNATLNINRNYSREKKNTINPPKAGFLFVRFDLSIGEFFGGREKLSFPFSIVNLVSPLVSFVEFLNPDEVGIQKIAYRVGIFICGLFAEFKINIRK